MGAPAVKNRQIRDPLGGNATATLHFTVGAAIFGVPLLDLVAGIALTGVAIAAAWVVLRRRTRPKRAEAMPRRPGKAQDPGARVRP